MTEPKKPIPPQANGLNEQGFFQWKTHPATKAFRKYLEDFAAALERDHMGRWKDGATDAEYEAEARGRVAVLREIATLEFEYMLNFYETPKDENDDERQTIEQNADRRIRDQRVDGREPVGNRANRRSGTRAPRQGG